MQIKSIKVYGPEQSKKDSVSGRWIENSFFSKNVRILLNYQFLINNYANYVNNNKVSVLSWLIFLFSMVFVSSESSPTFDTDLGKLYGSAGSATLTGCERFYNCLGTRTSTTTTPWSWWRRWLTGWPRPWLSSCTKGCGGSSGDTTGNSLALTGTFLLELEPEPEKNRPSR